MTSITEENYLKAIYSMSVEVPEKKAGTNEVAGYLGVTPATTNAMLKKLKEKQWVDYEKYGKISLTNSGERMAISIIRKHRLWETFLHQVLGFRWEEVHEVAEQLEHIQSEKLIAKLDKFLSYPKFDPHGEPIPDEKGRLTAIKRKKLSEETKGHTCKVIGVNDSAVELLKYMGKQGIGIGSELKITDIHAFDKSIEVKLKNRKSVLSEQVASHILVRCNVCHD